MRGSVIRPDTLLELGAGAGHNAFHLRRRFRCTLTDISAGMLALSGGLNPECDHVAGDMRTLRLGTLFDVVFVHDAVMYLTSEQDLRAVAETAFVHTRPGGAALFAPDAVRDTFSENTALLTGEDGDRSMRCVEWSWDPDPADSTYTVDYAFLLREGGKTTLHHDQHIEGLFSRAAWLRILNDAGYSAETVVCTDEGRDYEVFLARREAVTTP